MRLTQQQTQIIVDTIERMSEKSAEVFLFGSRLDDQARGGDVDILIETELPLTLIERAKIKMALEAELDLPVDIVSQGRYSLATPFQTIARSKAVKLEITA